LWLLVRYGAAERVASVFFMVPPVTAVLAWIFFGETMAVRAMAGMGLAAVGVFMVTRKSRPV
jgi:drug/metabolite transporter (DMT)-like permease